MEKEFNLSDEAHKRIIKKIMPREFNLSEKIEATRQAHIRYGKSSKESLMRIDDLKSDIKEFIRLLKEELCGFDKVGELAYKEIFESIDKLAGKEFK